MNRLWLSATGTSLLLALCVAGCPQTQTPDNTGADDDNDNNGTNAPVDVSTLSEEGVYDLLADLFGTDEVADAADDGQQATDEQVAFGEDPALYETASPDDVQETLEEVLAFLSADAADTAKGNAKVITPAAHGVLAGGLEAGDATDEYGLFRGRWFDDEGTVTGFVRGQYFELDVERVQGATVGGFFGKYIDNDGKFQGFLRGRFVERADESGYFIGQWSDFENRLIGGMRGQWTRGADGAFAGRWVAFSVCEESDTLPEATDAANIALDLVTTLLETFSGLDDPTDNTADETSVDLSREADLALGVANCLDAALSFGFLKGEHQLRDDKGGSTLTGRLLDGQGNVLATVEGGSLLLDEPITADGKGEEDADDTITNTDDRGDTRDDRGASADDAGAALTKLLTTFGVHGVFAARLQDADRQTIGLLRGFYGRSALGLGVFTATVISPDGQVIGTVLGRWDNRPTGDRAGGAIFGVWSGTDLLEAPASPAP